MCNEHVNGERVTWWQTVSRMGERRSRERPHKDVRARTFKRSEESGARAYRDVFTACLTPSDPVAV